MKKVMIVCAVLFSVVAFAQEANNKHYENGQVKVETYEVGDRLMLVKYFENGVVMESGSYVNGLEHGVWKTFNEDGVLLSEGNYEYGKKSGKWTVQANDKSPKYVLFYEEGRRMEAVAMH